jgi:hypothetical protein
MTTIVHHHDRHSRFLQQSSVKNNDLKTHLILEFKEKMEGTQMHFEAKSRELVVDCKYKQIPQLWL